MKTSSVHAHTENIYIKNDCIICSSARLHYLFSVQGYRVVGCDDCGLMMLNPQPSDEDLAGIYSADYFLLGHDEAAEGHVSEVKQATADHYLNSLIKYRGEATGRLLEIGCGHGNLLVRARAHGFDVTGVEYSPHACEKARQRLNGSGRVICGEIGALAHEMSSYDVCVFTDVIEHVRDPRRFLNQVHRLLKPGGVIFVVAPSLDSWSARVLRERWMEFKPEHLFYFNPATLQTLLFYSGFRDMVRLPCEKALSLDYIAAHFERYPVEGVSTAVALLHRVMPQRWRRKPISLVASGMIMMARKQEVKRKLTLSLVVPVYNEVATIEDILNKLLAKQLQGLDIEIVLVESNSTDGTRDAVLKYQHHARVKLVLEDRPQGKGHAVRTGLRHITGDFVLIQDADLEYDVEDYEALLEPLVNGREAFVLGARHGGRRSWKMRQFSDQLLLGLILNAGHWFFTYLVNVLYRLKLKDPFTMYKVFRRDCLYGLTFECDRFDFDYELLIKLVRKGYKPIEIPVNYRSRSFKQGKKVSISNDPWTWLRALVKYRFVKIDPLGEMVQTRKGN